MRFRGEAFRAHDPSWSWSPLSGAGAVVVLLVVVLGCVRARLVREPRTAATWGCGYAVPGPRMQYTASSFAASLLHVFHGLVRSAARVRRAEAAFPRPPSVLTWTKDAAEAYLFRPLSVALAWPGRITRLLHRVAVQYQVLFVIDSREQVLMVYEIENAQQRRIVLRDGGSLENLFRRARS